MWRGMMWCGVCLCVYEAQQTRRRLRRRCQARQLRAIEAYHLRTRRWSSSSSNTKSQSSTTVDVLFFTDWGPLKLTI